MEIIANNFHNYVDPVKKFRCLKDFLCSTEVLLNVYPEYMFLKYRVIDGEY